MKTNIILTILISVIILTSCGEKAKTEDINIIGKWEYSKINYYFETSDSTATANITTHFAESSNDDMPHFTVEFTSDGKVNNSIGINGAYSITGDKIKIAYDKKTHYKTEFQIKGDTLRLFDLMNNIVDERMKRDLGIDNSVEIKKAVAITNLVRKK